MYRNPKLSIFRTELFWPCRTRKRRTNLHEPLGIGPCTIFTCGRIVYCSRHTNICGGDCYHFCFCYCYFQYWCYLNLVPSACQAPPPSLTASALSPSLSFSLSLCLFWSRHLATFPWLGLHSLRSPDGNWSAILLLCCREQLGVQACAAMSGLIFATESLFREPLLLFSVS